jgi:hypothetical protein
MEMEISEKCSDLRPKIRKTLVKIWKVDMSGSSRQGPAALIAPIVVLQEVHNEHLKVPQ